MLPHQKEPCGRSGMTHGGTACATHMCAHATCTTKRHTAGCVGDRAWIGQDDMITGVQYVVACYGERMMAVPPLTSHTMPTRCLPSCVILLLQRVAAVRLPIFVSVID